MTEMSQQKNISPGISTKKKLKDNKPAALSKLYAPLRCRLLYR